MCDTRTLEIIVQVVYKAHAEKGLKVEFPVIESDAKELVGIISRLSKPVNQLPTEPSVEEIDEYFNQPAPAQPQQAPFRTPGAFCQKCGAKRVTNPKTGKQFCEKKCWLNP